MAVETKPASEHAAASPAAPARRELRADVVVCVATAVLTTVLALVVLRAWRADLDVPFAYRGETQYYLMLAKSQLDHGDYFENPSLGAPFGQHLHDYAVGTDRLHLDLLRVLGFLTGDAATAVNLFYLLTFPLVAAAAFVALRLLRIPRAPASVCAALFALAPYHFERGEYHLFLSAYWAVPLGAYLVLATLAGEPLFRRRPGRAGVRALASPQTLLTVAFCAAVASTGIYYAAFTLLLLVAATVLAVAAGRDRVAAAHGAVCVALIVVGVLIHLAPSIAYRAENGPNAATRRPTAESELLALKFTDLVLPAEGSRAERLAGFAGQYRRTTPIRSEGQSLGPVAAAGFLGLLAVALLALVGRRGVGPPLVRHAAAATVVAFLIGTVGGGAVLIAHLLTSQIRAWNRISIVIAFFALLAVAVALARLGEALGPRRPRRVAYGVALAGIVLVGVFVQLAPGHVPPYEHEAEYRLDRSFVREIERRLPPEAAVLELPYVAFPETGQVVDLNDNDLLRGYLHSERLRWSFGAMKGRPEDWVEELSAFPAATVVDGAVAAGFDGLYVDRFGYTDRAAALEAELRTILGVEPLVNETGRHVFFDLRGRRAPLESRHDAAALAAFRNAVLEPLQLAESGFAPLLRSGRLVYAWADEAQTQLHVVNPSDRSRAAVLAGVVERVAGAPAEVVVSFPGAPPIPVTTPAPIRREVTLPPGTTTISFSTDAPVVAASNANELRQHYFRVAHLAVTDKAFDAFLPP